MDYLFNCKIRRFCCLKFKEEIMKIKKTKHGFSFTSENKKDSITLKDFIDNMSDNKEDKKDDTLLNNENVQLIDS
jgi:hypothetical protein